MSVSIELPSDVLARLRAEAARRGVSLDELIAELAGQLPADVTGDTTGPVRHRLAFVAAGASRDGITTGMEQALADGFGRDWNAAPVLIVDTGVLVAAADRTDPHHDACARLLDDEPEPLTTTGMVLAETGYLLDRDLGPQVEALLYQSIIDNALHVDVFTLLP